MEGIIGKKIGMTSIYGEDGKVIPCTLVEAGPCVVTQIKTEENDGYNAVQIAFGDKREKNSTKAALGHFKKAGATPKQKLVEFAGFGDRKPGDQITTEIFQEGEWVDVTGISKGKGFQGVVKRHGFSGVGMQTHGQHNRLRAPGSLGAGSDPSRVFKGVRMAGRMGGKKTTILNSQVVKIMKEKNILVLRGGLPGAKGSFVVIHR